MARYQVLYWRHIPLGVKATDIYSVVRENLPPRFQEAFQQAATKSKESDNPYTTSGFRWTEEQEREGSAAAVAVSVARELAEGWDNDEALTLFEGQQDRTSGFQFINLHQLRNP